MALKIKSAYGKEKGSKVKTGPETVEQSHKKQCDINYILRDYYRSGLVRHAAKHQGRYDDISVTDFQEAMFRVTEAKKMFMELPSGMRNRFHNDPAEFLQFVHDPANKDEMAKLGILKGNDGLDIRGAAVGSPVPDQLIDTDGDGRPDSTPGGASH